MPSRREDDYDDGDSVYSESVMSPSEDFEHFRAGDITGGSFADQFLAIMERSFRQMLRRKFDVFLEIFIPMLFVIITLVLWVVWAPVTGPAKQFVNYTATVSGTGALTQTLVCYNASEGTIPTLQPCSIFTLFGVNVSCEGDDSTLPVKGLCYIDTSIDFSEQKVNGYDLGTVEGAMIPVQIWLNSFSASLFLIPKLDDVITFHWLARKADKKNVVGSIVGAGLMPNSKQTAIYCSGQLYFVSKYDLTGLLQYFNYTSELFHYVYNGTYRTSEEANYMVRKTRYNWAIIEINEFTKDGFDVNIRMNSSALPSYAFTLDSTYAGGFFSERADLYAVSGYSTLQKTITEYYLNYVIGEGNEAGVPATHYIASAGYAAFTYQQLLASAKELIPFIFVLAFLYPVSQMTKKIVLEKELRIREAMLIMGLSNTPLYLSWYVSFLMTNLVVCFLMVVIVKITYLSIGEIFVMVLICILYSLTCVPLSGFMSAFFSKARLASLLTPLIYFVLACPVFAITSANSAIIGVFCIFPPTAFAVALLNYVTHELSGGFGPDSWKDPLDKPMMYVVVLIMALDFVVYNLLMLYLDAVMPKDWGTPKHPLFFIIDPINYCLGRQNTNLEGGADGRARNGVFEEEETTSNHVVDLCGLRKKYKRGGKTFLAVNNLYWAMNEGEISVLLGHNGAGKTTVLNMMTGMTEPDQGDCYVFGLSIRLELPKVRQQVGFCPQHNILWPELTCREHLEFFGRIKGLKGWELEDAVCRMLYETDLMEKMEQPAHSLSGGQKRKLSVAIAFVASSRLVFLDEPTAGMDVGARRYTWELLRRMAETHTILLTTHYMDEADLLGHRIGIMSQGRLKCSGSSMFLKSNLGVGYSITMSLTPDADVETIGDLVLSSVEGANEMGINGCEAMYRLPNDAVRQFPALLDQLERDQEGLGIRGYSLSATTLEEVFLRVSEDDLAMQNAHDPLMAASPRVIERQEHLIWNCDIITSKNGWRWSQFKATMTKRLWNGMRDRRMLCFQIVCPMICILIAMLLSLISLADPPEIKLNSDMYTGTTVLDVAGCDSVLGPNPHLDTFTVEALPYPNALNVSLYEVDTYLAHEHRRLGALVCDDPEIAATYGTKNNVIHLINSSSFHQSPVAINAYYTALYTKLTGSMDRLNLRGGIMPKTPSEKVAEDAIKTILMGAIIMIPFTFLPSNPVAWVVKERECKARHLQNVSGLSFAIYWITNFLFDMAAYTITMVLVIIIFLLFGRDEYIGAERFGPCFVLFFIYGLSSTSTGYLCNFAFSEHSTAQTVVMAVSFVTGFLLVMVVFVMALLPNTMDVANVLRWIARLIPSFSIGEGIINLAMLEQQQAIGMKLVPWSMDVVGWPCVYMAIEFPVFLIITLLIDHPWRRQHSQKRHYDRDAPPQAVEDEDSDVEEERMAIYEAEDRDINDDMIRVVDLRKVYDNGKEAVKNLTFGVVPGEVFGFLGTNGAGKTTTISILCQEFIPTSGSAYVCGYDVVEENQEALQCIGYCPQFDATLDLLTVEEHLRMYAGIRGIEYEQRDDVVAALLRLCELSLYRGTLSAELSGGNRRKLSVAMALIGGPAVVFLDEPSAGMDPVARRGLWNAIEKVADKSSIVLTTHHLEEVEALAHRVAIMVDGTLRCIGDKTHLKTKYGTGFEMSIRVSKEKYCRRTRRWVTKYFPEATLNECKGARFVYMLPAEVPLSTVFRALQRAKRKLHITDYSVSQTSIEQVFLKISGELEELDQFQRAHSERIAQSGSRKTL